MLYKSAVLYYMSGTGNTHRVARWMVESARAEGIDARAVPLEYGRPGEEVTGCSEQLVGLLMPTHGFTAPWHGIRFALRMPRAKSRAFVLLTRAGSKLWNVFLPGIEGTGAYLIALILALKGYRIRGVMGLDMPSNWTALHPGYRPGAAGAIIERAKRRAEWFIGTLLAGGRCFSWGSFIELTLGLALLPVSIGYLVYARFLLSKLFFANARCNGCGICAANCPVQAVRMWGRANPRPFWTFSCESCMRCMNYCPPRAIEAGQSLGVLLWYVGHIPVAAFVFSRLLHVFPLLKRIDNGWGRFPLEYAYYLGAISLAYTALNLLMRISVVNKLFTYTTLTCLYRRYHEPGTALGDMRGEQ